MDAASNLVASLSSARALGNTRVGGKAAKRSNLIAFDYRLPRGLRIFCDRVVDDLIPMLEAEGDRLAAELLEGLTASEVAREIDSRDAAFRKWTQIYRDDFIPFAHGDRQFGTYYDDGEIVTVDRHLGVVTIGAPEFDLEAQVHSTPGGRFE